MQTADHRLNRGWEQIPEGELFEGGFFLAGRNWGGKFLVLLLRNEGKIWYKAPCCCILADGCRYFLVHAGWSLSNADGLWMVAVASCWDPCPQHTFSLVLVSLPSRGNTNSPSISPQKKLFVSFYTVLKHWYDRFISYSGGMCTGVLNQKVIGSIPRGHRLENFYTCYHLSLSGMMEKLLFHAHTNPAAVHISFPLQHPWL